MWAKGSMDVWCEFITLLTVSYAAFYSCMFDHEGPPELFQKFPTSGDNLCLSSSLPYVKPTDLGGVLQNSCALLGIAPQDAAIRSLLAELCHVFSDDAHVFIGQLAGDNSEILWKPSHEDMSMDAPKLAFYSQEPVDRTCLLLPRKTVFHAELYRGRMIPETLVQFLNEKCGTFRTSSGALTAPGLFHQHVMNNLYKLDKPVGECKHIKMPLRHIFIQDYLLRSRPVVIENAVENWPAMKKWSTEFLRREFGSKEIHIKLTPNGNFEGVESATLWADYHKEWIPEMVKSQLSFPDLVVVRPATSEMKFSDFLELITSGNSSYSAYLEYSSIPYHMPKLEDDIFELPFVENLLERRHLNIWLSDGNTLGKLHFDPYDNFLCQISGEKHLVLFDPHHNENLYESHIPEAILGFSPSTGKFRRRTLLQSTSMVMSPVDILSPDLDRFPRFPDASRLSCSLRPGDVLFMPAFWWHEVQSYPDPQQKRNLAVNFWYEPVFTKEFPCAECRLRFNQFYRNMLEDLPL